MEEGNGSKTTVGFKKTADPVNGEDDGETCLLLPAENGGRSKKSEKSRRKVQWNDHNGNKLAEVLEFDLSGDKQDLMIDMWAFCDWVFCSYPTSCCSEKGESGNEDSDACICTVM